jgi:ABC-2 type transport system ATP-binding protein
MAHKSTRTTFFRKQGEKSLVSGPNGAGKSTLMKILTTYIHPDEGSRNGYGYDNYATKKPYSL